MTETRKIWIFWNELSAPIGVTDNFAVKPTERGKGAKL